MSNQVTDKSLEKLLEYYKNAKESVIENIRAVRQRNGNDFYLRQALTQIEKELDKLYKQNKKWFEQQSELAFRRGYNQFSREIGRTASVEGAVNFVKMNNGAVEMLSQSATSNIGDALRQIKYNALYAVNKIGRRQDDVIADIGIKASAEALAVNAPSAAREQIIRGLAEKDIFSVTYRNGAKVSVEDYASMVARTTTHEAAATAKLIAAEQEGYDLVKMSTHYPTCKTCAQLQGRVYSISGKDKRFPPLTKAFKSGYNTVHPNCRHVVSVWAEEIKTDEEIKEASENSLKPFDIDPRSEKERELYASRQTAKRKVDKAKKSGIMSVEIDEFVPCLKDSKTGEILATEVKNLTKSEYSKYTASDGWNIDWKNIPDDEEVLGVYLKGDEEPQGLIAIRKEKGGIYLSYASTAPQNNKQLNNGNQKYIGVGGHLFAAAIDASVKAGNKTGCVFGYAANEKILNHYIDKFDAFHLPIVHRYQFIIEGEAALRVIETYNYERR